MRIEAKENELWYQLFSLLTNIDDLLGINVY